MSLTQYIDHDNEDRRAIRRKNRRRVRLVIYLILIIISSFAFMKVNTVESKNIENIGNKKQDIEQVDEVKNDEKQNDSEENNSTIKDEKKEVFESIPEESEINKILSIEKYRINYSNNFSQTVVTLDIKNLSDKMIINQKFEIVLLNNKNEILDSFEITIQQLRSNEETRINNVIEKYIDLIDKVKIKQEIK